MTKEQLKQIVSTIEIEEGDLIVCPDCDGLHDAKAIALNGGGPQMTIQCGGKIITL